MMQLLRQLLLGHQPQKNATHGRRAASTIPIGRMEQLEPRAMLSAAYGASHYVPEHFDIAAGAWESGMRTEQQVEAGSRFAGDGRIANLVMPIHNEAPIDIGHFGNPWAGLTLGWQPPPPKFYIVTVYVSARLNFMTDGSDIESSGSPSNADVPPARLESKAPVESAVASQSSPAFSGDISLIDGVTDGQPAQSAWVLSNSRSPSNGVTTSVKPPYRRAYNLADYSGLLFAPTPTKSLTGEDSTLDSVYARDTLFQDQTSLDLLLAADSDVSDDDGTDVQIDGDHLRTAFDEQMDAIDTLVGSRWCDDVGDSMNAIDPERAAIEEVPSQLPELPPFRNERAAEAPRASQQNGPNYFDEFYLVENEPIPPATTNDQAPKNDHHGGMVLIQAFGDANNSAYDLAAVVFDRTKDSTATPLESEAAVGVYQAFDFGPAKAQAADGKAASGGNSVAIGDQAAAEHQGGA